MPRRHRPDPISGSLRKKLGGKGSGPQHVVLGRKLLNAIVRLLTVTLLLGDGKRASKKFFQGVLAASLRASSLNAVPKAFRKALSGRRLREIAALMSFKGLRLSCHKALQRGLKKYLKGRLVDLAIDYTKIPYYGKPMKGKHELIRRKAERGTANHHAYAAIYVILLGFRFTLAVVPVRKGIPLERIVIALIREAMWCGIRIRCLLLDREFCTVAVQRALQCRRFAYCMAVKQQGGVRGVKAQIMKYKKRATRITHTWTDSHGRTVSADLYIVRRNARQGTGRTKTQYYTYAAWHIKMPPKNMKEFYRRRFGIESSYRMYNPVRARTSSRNPTIRYLYVVVAFVVLNQWTLTKYAACAKRQRGQRTIDEDRLPLKLFVDILYRALEALLGIVRDIIVDGSLPKGYLESLELRR